MTLLTISLRTLIIYFVILLFLRLMGKREIGKLSVFDLVISIMIAEIAAVVIEDTKKSIWNGIVPISLLVLIQMSLSYVSLHSRKLRMIFDGRPSTIIKNGKIRWKEMKKQRYTLDDLMLQLRENNVHDLADVEFAILETTGILTVFDKQQIYGGDAPQKKSFRYEGLPIPLIMDGEIEAQNLERIGKNSFWLKSQLKERGITDLKEVGICTYDYKGKLYIDRK